MDTEPSCTITNLLTETLTEEILTVDLRETEPDYQESYQNSVFAYSGPSRFRCKERNALFRNQVTFYEGK